MLRIQSEKRIQDRAVPVDTEYFTGDTGTEPRKMITRIIGVGACYLDTILT